MVAPEAAAAGVNWTFAPMIEVTRDPRWGPIAEGLGEDPCLHSVLGAAMVRGFQGDDLAAEGSMAAFSDLNGVPASGNRFLMRQVLREERCFQGFVVSDWASIEQLGTWIYDGDPARSQTPLQSIRKYLGDAVSVSHVRAMETTRSRSTAGFDEAIRAAAGSDAVVIFLGEKSILSGEAHSRADLLFGIESPSGKLPVTVPRMVGQGLSFTEFRYSEIEVSSAEAALDGAVTVSAVVTNAGDTAAEEVVQLYVRDLVGDVTRPGGN